MVALEMLEREGIMARPIEATPILTGNDARVFLDQIKLNEPTPTERLLWLATLAAQSKSAEE